MKKEVKGVIQKWTNKPKTGLSGTKAWAKISCMIDNEWYSVWATDAELKTGTYEEKFASIISNIPAGTGVKFQADIREGYKGGTIVKGTMSVIDKAEIKTDSTNHLKDAFGQNSYSDDVLGRVRHGVACAFITRGEGLNDITKEKMQKWIDYIMDDEESMIPQDDEEIVEEEITY